MRALVLLSVATVASLIPATMLISLVFMQIFAIGLDQIPESLLPLLVVMGERGLDWWDITLLVLAFTLFSLVASRFLYRFKLRKRPY